MDDKEVLWKCRRGTKELDILMSSFYHNFYKSASQTHKDGFVKLLSLEGLLLLCFFLLASKFNPKSTCLESSNDGPSL